MLVRFWNHAYHFSPNCIPLSSVTIINHESLIKFSRVIRWRFLLCLLSLPDLHFTFLPRSSLNSRSLNSPNFFYLTPPAVVLFVLINCLILVPQLTNLLDARQYDSVKIFLLFIGYNRSRHTLLASLLDAHPNIIVANDYNILGEWIKNPLLSQRSKYYMYELLYAKSRYDVMFGVRSRLVGDRPKQYHYNIKDQWQGRYKHSLQVCVTVTFFRFLYSPEQNSLDFRSCASLTNL